MAAFDTRHGRRRWEIQTSYDTRPVVNGRTVYLQPGAWDRLPGQKKDFQFERSYAGGILAGSLSLGWVGEHAGFPSLFMGAAMVLVLGLGVFKVRVAGR